MSNTELLKNCRNCSSKDLKEVFSLGEIYPSNFVSAPFYYMQHEEKLPLELVECQDCGLTQLKHTVDLDSMYRQYWYQSGLNASMKSDLKDIVESVENKIFVSEDDLVVDIGCNDGTLFTFYSNQFGKPFKVGFDPAYNLAESAEENCDLFINDYFSGDLLLARTNGKKATVITSIAMFYDLPDPNNFIREVKKVLDYDGIWVIQFTDLYSMFKINAFDNICHEHLEYYKLSDVVTILNNNGLNVFDVEYNKVNGGSVRIYVRGDYDGFHLPIEVSVSDALEKEAEYFNSEEGSWEAFSERYEKNKSDLLSLLYFFHNNLINVAGLGASTKGNTLLQAYDLSWKYIDVIGEINRDKFGLVTIGSHIPIQDESRIFNGDVYKHFIILPWHFRTSFLNNARIQEILSNGGALIFPLPEVTVVTKDGEYSCLQYMKSLLGS